MSRSAHAFFVAPYNGYTAINSAGQKGCEWSLLLSSRRTWSADEIDLVVVRVGESLQKFTLDIAF